MGKTTITHPDGSKTVIDSSGGCSSGCSGFAFIIIGVFVLVTPAQYFPLWLAIPAYAIEAAVAFAAVAANINRRRM